MGSTVNFRKITQDSHQEALLRQYNVLSVSDLRRSKRFHAHLSAEERSELEYNAHYDGSAWKHLLEDSTESLPLWEGEAGASEAATYAESMLGYFNVFAQRARRFSPAMPHQHSFVELYYVVKGTCTDTIRGQNLTLIPGDLVLLQPETIHSLSVPGDCVIYQAAVREHTFRNICQDLLTSCDEPPLFRHELEQEKDAFLLFRTGVDPELLALMEQMLIECAHPHKYFNVMLQGHLSSLMAFLLNEQEMESICTSPSAGTTLDEDHLVNYIQTHLSEVTLQSAASHFGFSTPYFCTLVREKTGQHFSVLLRQEKLSVAAQMLIETNQTIRKICEKTGYESVSQFSGTFKRNYGVSPGEYRRQKAE